MLMCWISVTANVVSWLYTLLQTSSEEAVFMFWLGPAQTHVIRLKEKITC